LWADGDAQLAGFMGIVLGAFRQLPRLVDPACADQHGGVLMGRAALIVMVVLAAGVAVFAMALDATQDRPPALAEASGEASAGRGREAIARYGCGDCHTIPGVREASATVGPPLTDWRDRAYVAGRLANTPPNLARWIAAPQSIEPGTAMPDLDVPPSTAREIADYLFSLR